MLGVEVRFAINLKQSAMLRCPQSVAHGNTLYAHDYGQSGSVNGERLAHCDNEEPEAEL